MQVSQPQMFCNKIIASAGIAVRNPKVSKNAGRKGRWQNIAQYEYTYEYIGVSTAGAH